MSDYFDDFYLKNMECVSAQDFAGMMTGIREHAKQRHQQVASSGKIDFSERAQRVRAMYGIHQKSTTELVAELYAVFMILKDKELKQKYKINWKKFCEEAGIHPETARNYIKKFIEKDESDEITGEGDLSEPTDKRKSQETIIERKVSTIRNMVEDGGKVKTITDDHIIIEVEIHGVTREIKVKR